MAGSLFEQGHHKPHTDMELIQASLGGDFGSFEVLVRRYEQPAYRLAWGLMKNEHDAQDVMQEAFLNIYRKLDSFEGQSQFASWVYRVVVNAGLNRLRRKKKFRRDISLEEATDNSSAIGAEVSDAMIEASKHAGTIAESNELKDHILEAIDTLEPKYQAVFLLREVEGLSMEELSDVLEISVPAVKSRLHRARAFLRTELEPYLAARDI